MDAMPKTPEIKIESGVGTVADLMPGVPHA
jgi:hypothetical protein